MGVLSRRKLLIFHAGAIQETNQSKNKTTKKKNILFMNKISLECDKYEVLEGTTGTIQVLRHGEMWRDLTGDKLFLAMINRIQELECAAKNIEGTVSEYLAMPCDSLRQRMKEARDRYGKRIYHSEA